MVAFFYRLIGDPRNTSLEHRLFNAISLINGVANTAGAFFTFYLPNFAVLFSINFGTGILFLIFYWFSRFRNIYHSLYWPFNLTILFFLVFTTFLNGGTVGGTHYYFIPSLVIATILLRNRNALFVYPVYILITAAVFLV